MSLFEHLSDEELGRLYFATPKDQRDFDLRRAYYERFEADASEFRRECCGYPIDGEA